MIRTQVLFTQELLNDLRLMAAQKGWSVSKTVRQLVEAKIKNVQSRRKPAVKMLRDMANNAYKGKAPQDLSSNDKYLYSQDV